MPGGELFFFGLFHKENQIGFQCFANYTPHRAGTKKIMHSNRTVIHPDYAGLGMGIQLINLTSEIMARNKNIRVMAKFSSTPVFKAMIKQKCWKFLGEKRTFGTIKTGPNMLQKGSFRDGGIKTYNFEFIG